MPALSAYGQQLDLAQQNYGNVLGAYQTGQANLSAQLPGITAGYGALSSQVGNTLGMGAALGKNGNWGVAAPAAEAIKNTYASNLGQSDQQLINAGLGNSTIRANRNSQIAYQAAQAYGGLGSQLASQYAGLQSNIGLSGLAAQMQGLGLQTNLYGQQGSALAGYHYPTPPYGAGGGGGISHGAAGNFGSPMDNQMFPFGQPTGVAGPGASGYSGGAGSALPGYGAYQNPSGGVPNPPGTTIYPGNEDNFTGAGWSNGQYFDAYGNNYSAGMTYNGTPFGSGMGQGWEGDTYYDY